MLKNASRSSHVKIQCCLLRKPFWVDWVTLQGKWHLSKGSWFFWNCSGLTGCWCHHLVVLACTVSSPTSVTFHSVSNSATFPSFTNTLSQWFCTIHLSCSKQSRCPAGSHAPLVHNIYLQSKSLLCSEPARQGPLWRYAESQGNPIFPHFCLPGFAVVFQRVFGVCAQTPRPHAIHTWSLLF